MSPRNTPSESPTRTWLWKSAMYRARGRFWILVPGGAVPRLRTRSRGIVDPRVRGRGAGKAEADRVLGAYEEPLELARGRIVRQHRARIQIRCGQQQARVDAGV